MVILRFRIWQKNAVYRRVVLCAPSRSHLVFQYTATCFRDEFEPRSRCCCTPINHCLRLHWKWGSLINQPSIEASVRLSELPRGSGEEQMRRCQRHSNCLPSSKAQSRLHKTTRDFPKHHKQFLKRDSLVADLPVEPDGKSKSRQFQSRRHSNLPK